MIGPLISVIVPIYKVEDYLDRCVDSIVNQTYKNLEIILVDDGSPDKCPEMCDEWAKKDNRIVVIHKENGGQAEARNFGIEKATGEYIGFVDSDDLISPIMFSSMIRLAVENNADIVGCGNILFDDNKAPDFKQYGIDDELTVFNQKEAVEDLLTEMHFKSTVWNLLSKSSIAQSVTFDVGKIHEDILWPFRVFLKSQTIVYTNECYYGYYQRAGSTMNRKYTEKRFDALDALEERANIIKGVLPELYPIATRAFLGGCMYHYQFLCRQDRVPEYNEYKKVLHTRFCNGDKKALLSGSGLKKRIWFSLFRTCPEFTCKVRNKLKIGI